MRDFINENLTQIDSFFTVIQYGQNMTEFVYVRPLPHLSESIRPENCI